MMMTSATGVVESYAVTVEYTPQERAAVVAWHLAAGACLSTAEVARRTGLTVRGAYFLMDAVSRVAPVINDNGRWRRMDNV
jgi:hypothetical protein